VSVYSHEGFGQAVWDILVLEGTLRLSFNFRVTGFRPEKKLMVMQLNE